MANDTSTSQLIETFITSGGWIEISIPDGFGGFVSKKISHTSFLATVNTSINTINTYINQAPQTDKFKSKSADFTESIAADTKIESIDFVWVSGTVSVKVGTSASGGEIISGRTVTNTKNSFNPLGGASAYFGSSGTLYFTISGGDIDIIINYRNNYNS
jgi:hypothetical protein